MISRRSVIDALPADTRRLGCGERSLPTAPSPNLLQFLSPFFLSPEKLGVCVFSPLLFHRSLCALFLLSHGTRTRAKTRARAHTHTQEEDMQKMDIAEFNIMCKTHEA